MISKMEKKHQDNITSDLLSLSNKLCDLYIELNPQLRELSYTTLNENKEQGYYPSNNAWIISQILKYLTRSKIIDLGCGCGILLKQLQCFGYDNVMGVEKYKHFFPLLNLLKVPAICKDIVLLEKSDIRNYDVIYLYAPLKDEDMIIKFVNNLYNIMDKQIIIYKSHGVMDRNMFDKFERIRINNLDISNLVNKEGIHLLKK